MALKHVLIRSIAVLSAVATLGLAGIVPAQAASTAVSGTVNCTGTTANYTTVRYMDQPARTELFLAKSAGGTLSKYAMNIGIKIVATGTVHNAYFAGANEYGTFQAGTGYVVGTRFTMNARMMKASSGACSNSWSGTLYY